MSDTIDASFNSDFLVESVLNLQTDGASIMPPFFGLLFWYLIRAWPNISIPTFSNHRHNELLLLFL